ncbi:NAD(P)-binding protein [Nanoarchaeota archaeon]
MINIIGGGPVGSYAAYILADKGFKVRVFEEHEEIGVPIQCTGITTKFLSNIVNVDDVLVNKTKRILIHSPDNSVEFNVENLILDRSKFDKKIAEMAENKGVKYEYLKKYIGQNTILDLRNETKIEIKGMVIGADGPQSKVGDEIGGERDYLYGVQSVAMRKTDPDVYEVWFGSFAPGLFAWSVPESDTVSRIGVACQKGSSLQFNKFLGQLDVKKEDIIDMQGGIIPIFNPNLRTSLGNKYVVGDAATQVKATTGGGIIPGMLAAESLVEDIEGKVVYEDDWRKTIGKELKTHLMIRNMLNKFSDRDYDDLVRLVKREGVKKTIEEHDREFPKMLTMKLLMKEPRFLKFAKYLL